MSNPFKEVTINSLDVQMDITPNNIRAALSSIELSETKVKPGQTIDINMQMNTYQGNKIYQNAKFTIPTDTPPGKYSLHISGGTEYERLIKKLAAHKFIAASVPELESAINYISKIKHDKIYILLR